MLDHCDKTGGRSFQVQGMARRRLHARSERGAVLVVCLGILVIMALMATAFLSSVTLRRDAGLNLMASSQAELAALAGREHVLRVLNDNGKAGGLTSLAEGWYHDFILLGAGATTADTLDMWAPVWPGIGSATNVTGAVGATLDYIEVPGVGGVMPKYAAAKWFTIGYLDRSRKRFSLSYHAVNFPIEIRYAVAIRDLGGLWSANGSTGTTISSLLTACGMTANTAIAVGNVCWNADGLKFANGNQANTNFSWEQIRGSVGTTTSPGCKSELNDKYRMLLTPFRRSAEIYVNVNTAPFMVLKAMLEVANADTAARNIVCRRGVYNSKDDVKNAAGVLDNTTIGILFNGSARGRWYIYKSDLFHAIIRGQVYDTLRLAVLAEANLEIVYCNNPADSRRILYQRWVSKTR